MTHQTIFGKLGGAAKQEPFDRGDAVNLATNVMFDKPWPITAHGIETLSRAILAMDEELKRTAVQQDLNTLGNGQSDNPVPPAVSAAPTPSWWHCKTHGIGNPNEWGCPECVREMRREINMLRREIAPTMTDLMVSPESIGDLPDTTPAAPSETPDELVSKILRVMSDLHEGSGNDLRLSAVIHGIRDLERRLRAAESNYLSAVKGRHDMREGLRMQKERAEAAETEHQMDMQVVANFEARVTELERERDELADKLRARGFK